MLSSSRVVVLFLLLALSGCGSSQPVGRVAGRVALDGKPVTGATIVFENPDTGTAVSANLEADGGYTIRTSQHDGLPPGEYLVAIRPGRIGGGEAPLVGGPEESTANDAPSIPAAYHSVKTSKLSAQVKEGDNPAFDFDLVAKP